jgi:predicted metal-dependent phosphoesterase TrpH
LRQTLKRVQEARANRNIKIVEKLQGLGIPIQYHEIAAVSGGGQIGRPHIAQVLVHKGAARSIDEAFKTFLRKDGAAYVSRYRLLPSEAIQMILGAGGVPVLGHPFTLGVKDEGDLEDLLVDLKEAGLKGMEVYYPEHGPERTTQYERLARRHGLVMTGGTDFHGAAKPRVQMGIGRGGLCIPYCLVEKLKAAKA